MLAVAAMAVPSVSAQGEFKSYEGKGFTMHVYHSNDVMADCSFIIETKKGLVTMEEPLFKSGVKEFEAYVVKLGKPVTARITDYHEGGTSNHPLVQPAVSGSAFIPCVIEKSCSNTLLFCCYSLFPAIRKYFPVFF